MKNQKTTFSSVLLIVLAFIFGYFNNDVNAQSIKIGNQTWTTKNLDVYTFRNGDSISEVKTKEEWIKAGESGNPAWCYYQFDVRNGEKYGKLYNWYAVNDTRGLAPKGWHIPGDEDWDELITYLGGKDKAGGKMKEITGWWKPNKGATNECGFSGKPGGYMYDEGFFTGVNESGKFWSTTKLTDSTAHSYTLSYLGENLYPYNQKLNFGLSVRCVKNK